MAKRTYLKKSVELCGTSESGVFIRKFTNIKPLSGRSAKEKGEGASCISYTAEYDRASRGVLKEIYPDMYGLKRDARGQLRIPEEFHDAQEYYRKFAADYLESYELLLEVKKSGVNPDLETFIPHFEIYHGVDKDGTLLDSAYIWSPDPQVETFETVCQRIHRNPTREPEAKLVQVLNAMKSLTSCILALHKAGLIHRDIKPSNFGFKKRVKNGKEEILTQSISLFDLDTITSVYSDFGGKAIGTEGYMEPEALRLPPTNQTDIYAIGATLFYAIVVCEETKACGYVYQPGQPEQPGQQEQPGKPAQPKQPEYYSRLHQLVSESELIKASEANSHPRLRSILTRILEKCLAPERSKRYQNCESLLDDLEEALYYAMPSAIAKKSRMGEKWILTDVEKSSEKSKNRNSALAIQYLLYEKPLYTSLPRGASRLPVLVLGFGNYGQKFLDTCLQAGQIQGIHLEVTVLSEAAAEAAGHLTDKEVYLADRPEMERFIDMDGSLSGNAAESAADGGQESAAVAGNQAKRAQTLNRQAGDVADTQYPGTTEWKGNTDTECAAAVDMDKVVSGANISLQRTEVPESAAVGVSAPESWGSVRFETVSLEFDKEKVTNSGLKDRLSEVLARIRPCYLFVALGEDTWNRTAAKACFEVARELDFPCTVTYVSENPGKGKTPAGLYPLYVNQDVAKSPLYSEIERMAFNVHRVWDKDLNKDYKKVWKKFREPYYHNSSVAYVLSLKYKLYSVGIDLDKLSFEEAALQYINRIMLPAYKQRKNEMICFEHRRWVMEKVCQGWKQISDLAECKNGVTQDKKGKRHVCIVRSRPDQLLAEHYPPGEWDTMSEAELMQLDELDRMSVELHRAYKKEARDVLAGNVFGGTGGFAALREQVRDTDNVAVQSVFWEFEACCRDILNGNGKKIHLYTGLKDQFLDVVSSCLKEKEKEWKPLLEAFEAKFYPVIGAAEYRVWKQDDVALVENIPFILTYSEDICLIVPYRTDEAGAMYANAAIPVEYRSGALFSNVAAATAINPERILYLYAVRKNNDLENLKQTLPYVFAFMDKKRFRAKVELLLVCENKMQEKLEADFETKLKELAGKRVFRMSVLPVADTEDMVGKIAAKLKREKGRLVMEQNDTLLSGRLEGRAELNSLAHFRFEIPDSPQAGCVPAQPAFLERSGCEYLGYIHKTPYISVSDLAAFRRTETDGGRQPEFFDDYDDLWKKYISDPALWKKFCTDLREFINTKETMAEFEIKTEDQKNRTAEECSLLFPASCIRGLQKILAELKKAGIAEKDSQVSTYTSELCRMVIYDRCGYEEKYNNLSKNIYRFTDAESIEVYTNPKLGKVLINYKNLVVMNWQLDSACENDLRKLAGYFREKQYLINLRPNITSKGTSLSFAFASMQIRQLLTVEGRILEIYVYHKLRETWKFHDIVSGCTLKWEGDGSFNEIDCIATKGFRSLFIECKARSVIEEKFYTKLARLRDKFGINTIAVLIADTNEQPGSETALNNAKLREEGLRRGVITVYKRDEITNIGKTLLEIAEGSYRMEA